MATIKDVAKLAGVSVGTVSNVINNINTVNPENINRVQRAIEELGYRPHNTARNLKISRTNLVYIVFPNISDETYSLAYSYLNDLLKANGLQTELHLTHDIQVLENEILQAAISNNPTAIILVTCQPHNKELFQRIMNQGVNLLFFNRATDTKANYIGFDNKQCIKSAVCDCLAEGKNNIVLLCGPNQYSTEQECIEGYCDAFRECNLEVNDENILSNDSSLASAYRTCSRLLSKSILPDVIISTSSIITDGLARAMQYSVSEKQPQLMILGDTTWNQTSLNDVFFARPVYEACKLITDFLVDCMTVTPFYDYKNVSLAYNCFKQTQINLEEPKADFIRALALKGDISDGITAIIPYIEKKLGIDILLDAVEYEDLYETIYRHKDDDYYDVYFFDLPWLHDLAENGILKDITRHITSEFFQEVFFEPTIFDAFAKHHQSIFALPFIYTVQLLFYRKDLFEDWNNKIKFKNMYRANLVPPKTWTEYNAIAKFFTKEFNPDSQVQYGTTLAGKFSSAVHVEYLTRMWAYQNDMFDADGMPQIDSINAINALENYVESYRYASADSINNWWYEQVEEFMSGNAAMMIMYSSHVAPIVDHRSSKVLGKVGYAPVPGGKHTLGGWSVGMNAHSMKEREALSFIKMICGKDLAIPLTLLGCFSSNNIVFSSNVIADLYPWVSFSLDVLSGSKSRQLPEKIQHLSYKDLEQILAEYVRKSIKKNLSPREALETAAREMKAYIEKYRNKQ